MLAKLDGSLAELAVWASEKGLDGDASGSVK